MKPYINAISSSRSMKKAEMRAITEGRRAFTSTPHFRSATSSPSYSVCVTTFSVKTPVSSFVLRSPPPYLKTIDEWPEDSSTSPRRCQIAFHSMQKNKFANRQYQQGCDNVKRIPSGAEQAVDGTVHTHGNRDSNTRQKTQDESTHDKPNTRRKQRNNSKIVCQEGNSDGKAARDTTLTHFEISRI